MDFFSFDDGTHRDAAVSRAIRVLDPPRAENLRTGGEIRPLDSFENGGEKFLARGGGVGEVPESRLGNLAKIVRRNVRRHSDGDTHRAIDEQVGEPAGQNRRLAGSTVVVVLKVDGVFVDVAHHLHRERSHAGFGVSGGGRAIISWRTEVSLAGGERVAEAPRLH